MKLLYCLDCQDVLKIINELQRTCKCGACTGILAADELTATVTGPCQVLGVGSRSVALAAIKQTQIGDKGLRTMVSPAMAKIKEVRKKDPDMALLMAAALSQSAFKAPLKGRGFDAFIIPYQASTVLRDKIPDEDYFDARLQAHNRKN